VTPSPSPPPSLRELQAAFWRVLAGGPGTSSAEPGLLSVIERGGRLVPAERVRIYAEMYLWRIADALAEDFPKLAATLGGDAFVSIVREYLVRHPSREPSIRHVGRELAAFLGDRDPPWLADLGRLEWARLEVFDAPDVAPLSVETLRRVPAGDWPALRFTLVPACVNLVTAWPVHQLWTDAPPPLAPARTALRVWRQAFAVYHAAMEPAEEAAFRRLAAGDSFAVICEVVDDPTVAAALLLRWLEDGLVVGTDPEPPSPT